MIALDRRRVLQLGAAVMVARSAGAAAALAVPAVDALELAVIVDGQAALFGVPVARADIEVVPTPLLMDYRTAFAAQWAWSVLATSRVGREQRRTLVDFGYTPEALVNNLALLKIDAAGIDAMVLSHGHRDHFGGLDGLLATGRVRRGTPLFVGGEEAFCDRVRGTTPDSPSFGPFDRAGLAKAGIAAVVGGAPALVAGHGFTTGTIPLVSPERPKVPTGMFPGRGCDVAEIEADKRGRDFVVDDAVHELGTAFHVAGKGLVVIGSCSHRGIINTVRQAQAVSGVEKVHAIVGGFHLVPPQTPAQVAETVALMQAIGPDYIVPGHCSGELFIAAATAAMPGRVLRSVVGTRYRFGARTA